MSSATATNLRRYSRHLLIPEVGLAGQERLLRARVLVVGAGGLGAPVLQYLAAAGVGRIGVVDDDVVDETNLQRQVVFATADLGRPKALAAAEHLRGLNPGIAIDAYPLRFEAGNARDLVRPYELVIDATDTFGSRYLVNDACHLEGKADVYGAIFRFDGQVTVFSHDGPCYRCLFPEPPPEGSVPTCAEGGVLGVLAGMVGTWQANEALKLLLKIGRPLVGRVALLDALEARVREFALARDPECPLCGTNPTLRDVAPVAAAPAESLPPGVPELPARDLDLFLENDPRALVLDVREPHEVVLGGAPRSLHLPASQLEARMHELNSATPYVVACRVGVKSTWAARRLWDAGFRRLHHLEGGLLAYAAQAERFDAF